MVDRHGRLPSLLSLRPLRNVRPTTLSPPDQPLVTRNHRMYLQESALEKMTAAWLLPIVSTIVAAATGGIVAEVLPNPQHALWTVLASYVLWGTGVPLAMVVLVIYFQRLTLHHLPPIEVAVSVFLPLGPLGQGGYGIMQLGKVSMTIFPQTLTLSEGLTNSGDILYVVGWLVATIMWGFALVWMFFAAASITRRKFPFNMGWWGFTFPLGVFTASTTQMGRELPSRFFDVFGTVGCFLFFYLLFFPTCFSVVFFSPLTPSHVGAVRMLNRPLTSSLIDHIPCRHTLMARRRCQNNPRYHQRKLIRSTLLGELKGEAQKERERHRSWCRRELGI